MSTMNSTTNLVTILNPKVRRVQKAQTSTSKQSLTLSPVPPDLNGKTIGFLDNGKKNFDVYLARTDELLRRHYTFTTLRRRKAVPIKGVTSDLFQEMISGCDVVITGSGD
jgi:hypothetical protein